MRAFIHMYVHFRIGIVRVEELLGAQQTRGVVIFPPAPVLHEVRRCFRIRRIEAQSFLAIEEEDVLAERVRVVPSGCAREMINL